MTSRQSAETSRSEEQGTAQPASADEAWREVGRQVEALGESLSRAFRVAWRSEETQHHVQTMQDSLEKVARKIEEAVKEADESDRGKAFRAEAERTARSLQRAGEETWSEVQPQLISALTTVNAELETFIERMERGKAGMRDSETSAPCHDA